VNFKQFTPIIYAEESLVIDTLNALSIKEPLLHFVESVDEVLADKINVVNAWKEKKSFTTGNPDPSSGACSLMSLEIATQDLLAQKVDVLVTAPIDKRNIQSETFKFPGHTEYLAHMSGADEYIMLLVSGDLRVGVVTGHIPLSDVAQSIQSDKIVAKLKVIHKCLIQDFGIEKPKIAVLGLNPHAGDQGIIGKEEETIITPALKSANDLGISAMGPYPADGLFGSSHYKQFDAILAMYHDQGLVPFKALSFGSGVNFTAGLPIVRSSPDHGTAYDIAGQGVAEISSFREALMLAIAVYQRRDQA